MVGGKRPNINDYNKSVSPEVRRENGRKGGKAVKKPRIKTIRELARIINAAAAQDGAKESLRNLGLSDEVMTNAALIAASVFREAVNGDLRAVEKWERYTGQADVYGEESADGRLADLIDGLKEPCDNDLYAETAGVDGIVEAE